MTKHKVTIYYTKYLVSLLYESSPYTKCREYS